ncbi:unnamed protein product (macronuclear) [Paramecium tetraurelia]|uniref:Glutathione S-transferase n=1 Tax=Paramecium tetraurelia TaxID=5888 RepID=A0CPW3_PARTE|nr:uncharacterized protein GSPATT00009222001 [Paramecium tetraurelia]CAK72830.1 unnamed protein product [Paramecium tetraurelia]|eukprot:XP_001440227.1 hypothetical protein (macronuclear) [Paramecium tetraurelia strain d4-2]
MSLIFYFSPQSPPSRAVRSLLLLSKVVFQGKVVDLMKGEHKTPEYQYINPNQSLPALVDGELKLFESHAILKYIAIKKELTQFYPKDIQNRARVDCYLDWSQTGLDAIGTYTNQCFLFPMLRKKPVPQNKEQMYQDTIDTLQFFESIFLKGRYIQNQPSITIADLKCIADLTQLLLTGLDFNQFPKIRDYLQEMFSLPEIREAYAEYLEMIKNTKPNDSISYIISGIDKRQNWQINLYHHPFSSPSRAARTTLLYSGVEYNEKIIYIQKGQNKTPEYQAINPNESLPAIQDGNLCLFESGAIMKYIAQKFKLSNLYPFNLKAKAQVDLYMDFHLTEMSSLTKYAFSCFLGPAVMKLPIPSNKDQQLKDVKATLEFFVKVFLNKGNWAYINGSPIPTLADIKACCDIAQLLITDFPFEHILGLDTYVQRVFQMPEMKKSHREYFQLLQSQKIGKFALQITQMSEQIRPKDKLTLYFNFVSPPSKAVKSLLKLAQITYTEKDIDLKGGENTRPPYTNINPNQTLPAITFGNFSLFESHAIMKFICIQFNLTEFYPNYPLRSKIDSFLDFHHTGFKSLTIYTMDFFFGPKFFKKPIPNNKEERIRELNESLQFFIDTFLGGGHYKYIMGSKTPTIADLTFIGEISGLFLVDFDFTPFPSLKRYLRNLFEIKQIRDTYSKYFLVARFLTSSMNDYILSIVKGTKEGESACCQLI